MTCPARLTAWGGGVGTVRGMSDTTQSPAAHAAAPSSYSAALTPSQVETFDQLLVVGGDRPYMPASLVEDLRSRLLTGTAAARGAWTERSVWMSKAMLFNVLRCEAAFKADRERNRGPYTLHPNTAAGTVAHLAIQMTHTHPGRPVEDLVRSAIVGARRDEKFNEFWEAAELSTQSDVLVLATSRTTGYLDAWPPMHSSWAPRFEEPISARLENLTLSGRVDLLLGRPRSDGRQTMMIVDWKSGNLNDQHPDEAAFYALIATLRFGVAPYRSLVYSLASGTWTDPDVTPEVLFGAADKVVAGVNAMVETMTESREPSLSPGTQCGWCVLRATCPSAGQTASVPASPGPLTIGPGPVPQTREAAQLVES